MKELLNYLPQIKKALVPLAVGGVLAVLGYVGVTGDMTVKEAVTLVVTAGLVWLTKNVSK